MATNLLRSFGLVTAIALVPAATAAFAQVDVDNYRELDQFMNVLEQVRANYVEEVTDEQLIKGAIEGMLTSLDAHSGYLDARGFQSLRTGIQGEYGGLGLSVTMEDGAVKVIAPTEGAPGQVAGVRAGDYITHLDGRLIYGGTLDEAVEAMRGTPGTSIKLTIVRPGRDRPFDVTVTRALIDLPAVRWEVRERVGVININTFTNENTTQQVSEAITGITRQLGSNLLGYVIDLRSNPGGQLDQAINVSDLFLNGGEVVSQRGRGANNIERYYARPGDSANGLPIVVLVDAGSASAAEIVAAALQDHRRAVIMGERTFGKGSVQSIIPLSETTALRLTTARYYTPSGRSVQEGGVAPDISVPQLSDPDYRSRTRIRESDLRRHLVNEGAVGQEVLQDDGRPDPRFSATPEQLRARGIEDFQLHYALQTLQRLARGETVTPAPAARPSAPRR